MVTHCTTFTISSFAVARPSHFHLCHFRPSPRASPVGSSLSPLGVHQAARPLDEAEEGSGSVAVVSMLAMVLSMPMMTRRKTLLYDSASTTTRISTRMLVLLVRTLARGKVKVGHQLHSFPTFPSFRTSQPRRSRVTLWKHLRRRALLSLSLPLLQR